MKKFLLLFAIVAMIAIPLLVSAQTTTGACSRSGVSASGDSISTFPKCISQIYIWSLGIAALLALLMTVVGAYKYMTAAGNAESAQKGSEMIWGAIIGLALLFGAYLLLNTINPDLVNFRIGSGTCLGLNSFDPVPAATKADCESTPGNHWYSVTETVPTNPNPATPCNPATMTCLPPPPPPPACDPNTTSCIPPNMSPLGQ